MHDPRSVGRDQGLSDLGRDIDDIRYRQFGSTGEIAKGSTFDKFAHDKVRVLTDTDLVDHKDVRVVQRRSGFSLAYEPLKMRVILSESFVEDFYRHAAIELFVIGKIDFAHPADADLSNYLVV